MSAEDSPSPSSPSESKHSYDGELGRAIRSLFVVKVCLHRAIDLCLLIYSHRSPH